MGLDIPLPTADVYDDPAQYLPLLLSAVGVFLQSPDIWFTGEFDEAYAFMENLKSYLAEFWGANVIMPVGTIQLWMTDTPPDKWLLCEGQAVSRTVYADLFALWQDAFGAGDGTTTFNLPNFQGRSPYGDGGIVALGETLGSETHTITKPELPAYNLTVNDPGHTHAPLTPATSFRGFHSGGAGGIGAANNGVTNDSFANTAAATTGITVNLGGSGQEMSILHPVIGVKYIVYTGV